MLWRIRLADEVLPQPPCHFQKITHIRTQKQQAMNLLLLRCFSAAKKVQKDKSGHLSNANSRLRDFVFTAYIKLLQY